MAWRSCECWAACAILGSACTSWRSASFAEGGTFLQADYSVSLGQFVRVATYFGAAEPFAEAVLVGPPGAERERDQVTQTHIRVIEKKLG